MEIGRLRHKARVTAAAALAISSLFAKPLNPLTERSAYAQTNPRCSSRYPLTQDPLAMSPEMERLAQYIERRTTNPFERIARLYSQLRSFGIRGPDSVARIPLSAAVAFQRREAGCGEFAMIVTPFLMRWNIQGGAVVINPDGTLLRHIAPYVRVGAREILIDRLLAETGPREFHGTIPETFASADFDHARVIGRIGYGQVPFVYFFETGRYFMRCPGFETQARRAFREAIRYDPDFGPAHLYYAESFNNYAVSYSSGGSDTAEALPHLARAIMLIQDNRSENARAQNDFFSAAEALLDSRHNGGMRNCTLVRETAAPLRPILQGGERMHELLERCGR